MPEPGISRNLIEKIGIWSEVKLEIIRRYAQEYSRILSKQKGFSHYYIDAFAGTGIHESRETGELIPGSPKIALETNPPFFEYHFIDINNRKVKALKQLTKGIDNAYVYEGDCNEILIEQILPLIRFEEYKRALCFLDPYGLDLNWEVVKKTGEMKTIDIFLNFPVLDMNRNVLLCDPEQADPSSITRMNKFWGNDDWKDIMYLKQKGLFGEDSEIKTGMGNLVAAYRKRLREVAGFPHVPEPIPMKNKSGGLLYYLFFASQKKVAEEITQYLFKYKVAGL